MDDIRHGSRDGFWWVWSRDSRLSDVLAAVPELVVGKIVAVTSFDSGPLSLTEEDLRRGWTARGSVALSPVVQSADQLSMGEWDEWYVLDEAMPLPELAVFVNFDGFTPSPMRVPDVDATWCKAAAADLLRSREELANAFWSQISAVRPFAFIAEGDSFTCVVSDEKLARKVLAAMEAATDNT